MTHQLHAMVLQRPGRPLVAKSIERPQPSDGQVLIRVRACGVCRTDLHVVDGDLTEGKLPIIPSHEIVGEVVEAGPQVERVSVGERVGVPWLGYTCGRCSYCTAGRENLCDEARFTGYQIDGGYADYTLADARYVFPIHGDYGDAEVAPLLCAGLIGYRSLRMAGDARRLGLYGFGAAAHIVAQVAGHEGREVYAFTRPGDLEAQRFARDLGAAWAGDSRMTPPDPLDAAIIYAPVGSLVPAALAAVRKWRRGGLRRHPYVGHSSVSVSPPVGGAHGQVGRQPDARRRRRVSATRTSDTGQDRGA